MGDIVLTGEHTRSLDDKGRLSLPPAFRSVLAEGAYVAIYKQCLGIWTAEEARSALERLEAAVRAGEATGDEFRRFSSSLEPATVDAQGRLNLPASKREALGLDKNVVLVGVFNRGEVWDADEWESVLSERSSDDIGRWL
ncbi:MAG: cell division/cell wall cluster transcriptional repressor MraZ [bacterium]|nr:cell division/cell wall cluster transcriptional repressor MraZ [bacterium]MCY3631948.1 cell division/cell wall cluster transcriptional repressor MraZ [bacterium]